MFVGTSLGAKGGQLAAGWGCVQHPRDAACNLLAVWSQLNIILLVLRGTPPFKPLCSP
jgi:hypothetical protein